MMNTSEDLLMRLVLYLSYVPIANVEEGLKQYNVDDNKAQDNWTMFDERRNLIYDV